MYKDTERAIAGLQIGYNERQRATSLVRADKQVHVSYQAPKVTVELFSQLNQNALDGIERETSPERQSDMMWGNAIRIYELTDLVISYIDSFTVKGADEIEALYMETKGRIEEIKGRQCDVAERANGPGVEPTVRRQMLDDVQKRQFAIDELVHEWDKYVREVKELESTIDQVQTKVVAVGLYQAAGTEPSQPRGCRSRSRRGRS